MPKKKTNLRQEAKGQPCMIRLPGICNFLPETTVLAHFRQGTGLGRKPPDTCGAWACSACHDAVDGRMQTGLDPDDLRLQHLRGVIRTLNNLESDGWGLVKDGEELAPGETQSNWVRVGDDWNLPEEGQAVFVFSGGELVEGLFSAKHIVCSFEGKKAHWWFNDTIGMDWRITPSDHWAYPPQNPE